MGAEGVTTAGCEPLGDGRHIVLIGMTGSGKSAVGRALAAHMDRPLFDSDEMVEQSSGMTVREIWETSGESEFRKIETQVLSEALSALPPAVIATGGGIVVAEENRRLLADSDAHVVWLLVGTPTSVERVKRGAHRPLLDGDPERKLQQMLDERQPLYQEVADAIVSAENRSIHDVAKAVLRCCV